MAASTRPCTTALLASGRPNDRGKAVTVEGGFKGRRRALTVDSTCAAIPLQFCVPWSLLYALALGSRDNGLGGRGAGTRAANLLNFNRCAGQGRPLTEAPDPTHGPASSAGHGRQRSGAYRVFTRKRAFLVKSSVSILRTGLHVAVNGDLAHNNLRSGTAFRPDCYLYTIRSASPR